MIVQLIAIGVIGWHGAHALLLAEVESKQDRGSLTILLNNLVVPLVLATMKSVRIVTLDLAHLLALNSRSSYIILLL